MNHLKFLAFTALFITVPTTLAGCGKIGEFLGMDDDEIVGVPVRPVPAESTEEPAPYPPNRKIYSSVGFYSRGYLWSRDEVLQTDTWNVRARTIKQGHNFVSIYVTDTLRQAIQSYYKADPSAPIVELWDMSNSGGGLSAGHLSHRNGLDVDLRYTYVKDQLGEKRSLSTIDYDKLWSLVSAFHGTGKVARMFVDSKIKARLCSEHKGDGDSVLRLLRPYKNHDDHVHIRFYCPKEDSKCINQVEVPAGNGC